MMGGPSSASDGFECDRKVTCLVNTTINLWRQKGWLMVFIVTIIKVLADAFHCVGIDFLEIWSVNMKAFASK